jgi:hypothetical protein
VDEARGKYEIKPRYKFLITAATTDFLSPHCFTVFFQFYETHFYPPKSVNPARNFHKSSCLRAEMLRSKSYLRTFHGGLRPENCFLSDMGISVGRNQIARRRSQLSRRESLERLENILTKAGSRNNRKQSHFLVVSRVYCLLS